MRDWIDLLEDEDFGDEAESNAQSARERIIKQHLYSAATTIGLELTDEEDRTPIIYDEADNREAAIHLNGWQSITLEQLEALKPLGSNIRVSPAGNDLAIYINVSKSLDPQVTALRPKK